MSHIHVSNNAKKGSWGSEEVTFSRFLHWNIWLLEISLTPCSCKAVPALLRHQGPVLKLWKVSRCIASALLAELGGFPKVSVQCWCPSSFPAALGVRCQVSRVCSSGLQKGDPSGWLTEGIPTVWCVICCFESCPDRMILKLPSSFCVAVRIQKPLGALLQAVRPSLLLRCVCWWDCTIVR